MGIEDTTFQTLAECSSTELQRSLVMSGSSVRLRAVSYFPLQSYYTRNLRTRAAKPRAARNEAFLVWSQSLIVIITSWFAIALDEIRTRRILREKADRKQSIHLWADITTNKVYYVICANGE